MGLLDIFSGDSGRNAAIWGGLNTATGANQQRDYLTSFGDLSLAALGQGRGEAVYDLTGQHDAARQALQSSLSGQRTQLEANVPGLQAAGARADSFYQPLAGGANAGFSAYGDAAGANGAEGQARARSNFQTGPGYNFARDEALNAATRGANATGMGASGNTMDALSRLGTNLANQEWGSYVNRLSPYLTVAPGIANQRAGIAQHTGDQLAANNKALADMYGQYGQAQAGLSVGLGNTLASLSSGLGSNRANTYTGLGQNLSNVTGAQYGTTTNLGTAGMMAGQQGNANLWNAGMQVANLAADTAGKFTKPFA